ncbi:MAG: polysaccharide biosynthesis/export family protein, partial [Pseudomonadota bacterium]|nr:polysaccharide biosynthesis/export family protein [Pseudomonadota bacterium]
MKQLLLLLCLIFLATSVAAEEIKVGNKLFVYLPGEADFSQPFEVDKDGSITLPELGRFNVAGLELKEIEAQLKKSLSEVFVAMDDFYVEIHSRDIFINVMGYVNEPSQVSIPNDGNIQMVIARAGGLKPGAQLDRLQIRRANEIIEFNYKAYLDSGNIDLLPSLQSADTVFVPVSPLLGNVQIDFDAQTLSASGDASDNSAITLLGEVHNPGSFSFKENMSVLDALMRAEGVTRYAD